MLIKSFVRTTSTILLIVLLLCQVGISENNWVFASFANGSGTYDDPYLISTAEELNAVRNYLGNHYKQVADIDLSSFPNWEPIGNYGNEFKGSYNGGGYVITNLTVNKPDTDAVGLFGYISVEGGIKNLGIENANIKGKDYVGSLVGQFYGLKGVENCYSIGVVEGQNIVGNLVGMNATNIKNSYSTGTVIGGNYVGGLAGQNFGGIIDSCYSVVSVYGNSFTGGVVGISNNNNYIQSCFYNADAAEQSDSDKGIPLAMNEMKQQVSFTGFDFVNVWKINEGISFPQLDWEKAWRNTEAPTVEKFSPANGSDEVILDTNLSVHFDKDIYKEYGTITIYNNWDDSIVKVIDIRDGSVAISGASVHVDLSAIDLEYDSTYYITISKNSFKTLAGIRYEGIDNNTWIFTTERFNNPPPPPSVIESVYGVTLNKERINLTVGKTENLIATVNPDTATNKAVEWSSSNSNVAEVDSSGKITALESGTAIIIVRTIDGNYTAATEVNVTSEEVQLPVIDVPIIIVPNEPSVVERVYGVTLNKASLTLSVGEREKLAATIVPVNATNKAIEWSSSDTNVALVDETGRVTGISAGTAIISVRTKDGNHTATAIVTVKKASKASSGSPNNSSNKSNKETLNNSTKTVNIPINNKVGSATASILKTVSRRFIDVPDQYWAAKVINELADKGIIHGTTPNTYEPNRNVTRAEFVILLVQALQLTDKEEITFADIKLEDWYTDGVRKASKVGIVKGKSPTKFEPNSHITREEMTIMLLKAYEHLYGKSITVIDTIFDDETIISWWALDAVKRAAGLKLIQGRGNNRFEPKGITSRAEAAQAVYNLLKIKAAD